MLAFDSDGAHAREALIMSTQLAAVIEGGRIRGEDTRRMTWHDSRNASPAVDRPARDRRVLVEERHGRLGIEPAERQEALQPGEGAVRVDAELSFERRVHLPGETWRGRIVRGHDV